MHLALASNVDDASFAPIPYSTLDRRSNYQSVRNLVGKTLRMLRDCLPRISWGVVDDARRLVGGQEQVLKVFEPYLGQRLTGLQIRTHGDYHLEQLLYTGKDFVIIDFDGPPTETLADRRRRHNCLRDVAGMIRSFHYAAFTALLETAVVRPEDRPFAKPWADAWYRWVSGAFLRSYLAVTTGAPFLPAPDDIGVILDAHVLQKAFHEMRSELERCAETLTIPLSSIVEHAGL
jgi:maltose alpha-D-glucosyltransferase/alpha-amylase